jgi:hypothetical protein
MGELLVGSSLDAGFEKPGNNQSRLKTRWNLLACDVTDAQAIFAAGPTLAQPEWADVRASPVS